LPTLHAKQGTLARPLCNASDRVKLQSVRLSFLALSVLFVPACGHAADPSAAPLTQQATPQARCEAVQAQRLAGDQVTLVASFESTALEIAAWQESGRIPGGSHAGIGQSPLRSFPPGETIASCYFDGTFTFRWPLPQGATPPVFERMLFLVDGTGQIIQEAGGTKKLYPLVRPAA